MVSVSISRSSALTGASGGAFYIFEAAKENVFDTCVFKSNNATSGSGGALYLATTSASANFSLFRDNDAHERGGAVSLYTATLRDDSSTYRGNGALEGGALDLTQTSTFRGKGLAIEDSTARDQGGAIWADHNGLVVVEESTFARCVAANHGGAIAASSATTRVHNSSFTECSVTHADTKCYTLYKCEPLPASGLRAPAA